MYVCTYLREEGESSAHAVRYLSLDEPVALGRHDGRVHKAKEDGTVDSVHRGLRKMHHHHLSTHIRTYIITVAGINTNYTLQHNTQQHKAKKLRSLSWLTLNGKQQNKQQTTNKKFTS